MERDRQKELEKLKREYQEMKIPVEGYQKMKDAIDRAKMEKRRRVRKNMWKSGMTVAAAVLMMVALPNVNDNMAYACEQVPVLGAFFRVVTVKNYQYSSENRSMNVAVPQLSAGAADEPMVTAGEGEEFAVAEGTAGETEGMEDALESGGVLDEAEGVVGSGFGSSYDSGDSDTARGKEAVGGTQKAGSPESAGGQSTSKQQALGESALKDTINQVNLDIDSITEELVERFKKELEESEEGYSSLDVDYEVVTDNDRWYTLKLSVLEVQASGYEYYRYYTIDKTTGSLMTLKELVGGDKGIRAVSEEIKRQMEEQMSKDEDVIFFLDNPEVEEWNFEQVKDDQNFYFDGQGNLVIVFDEYEVAPGSMGAPEFTIKDTVWK